MSDTIQVRIVSQEGEVYSGEATELFCRGESGELGIHPGHSQLLSLLRPGAVRVRHGKDDEELMYVSGGLIEVQPQMISILADTVERPQDVNESASQEAVDNAEKILSGKGDVDYHKTMQDLAEAMAKLRVLQMSRNKRR